MTIECKSVDDWMGHISESLADQWEDEDELSIEELVYDMIDNSKTAMLSDALLVWKQSGLSKEEFIDYINDYFGYTKAMSIFIKAAAIASEQVIPD